MTYKETLYFVSNCLSLVKYPERSHEISKLIISDSVDWDNVVRLSSNQMIVPALYYNLKQANLLKLLPEDLVYYLEEISNSNKQRNEALIIQANHLVKIATKHKVNFVFLKGMAHVLEGLYMDTGERMVGDIDILVAKDEMEAVINILIEEGYKKIKNEKVVLFNHRHYSRLVHESYIGSIEIHWNVVKSKHASKLPKEQLLSKKQKISNFYVPSYAHQALHNILNAQINDKSYHEGTILLRQLYDCFLLSFKPGVQETLKKYKEIYYLKNIYLKWLDKLFKPKTPTHDKSFLLGFMMLRYELTTTKNLYRIVYLFKRIYNYPYRFVLAFTNREVRYKTITNLQTKGWLKRHLSSYKKWEI